MKLWQKKSTLDTHIESFTIGRDQVLDMELAHHDVLGTMAHVIMLAEMGIIELADAKLLSTGLLEIHEQIQSGQFAIENGMEDVHSQIENLLTRKLGDAGKKVHTARSRNDQVLTALRLYIRDQLLQISKKMNSLIRILIRLSNEYADVFLPGFTHYQLAMPSSFGNWFGAYAESFKEDLRFISHVFQLVNRNPLGSAAGFGVNLPIKKELTTIYLGFQTGDRHEVFASMGRGKSELQIMHAFSNLAMTFNRFASDIILYSNQRFGYIQLPDEFTTGSSIMPHKKNPDVFELIRGKSNQLHGSLTEMLMLTSNLISGYHRDYQLLKEGLMDSFNRVHDLLDVSIHIIPSLKINTNIYAEEYQLLFTTDAVYELVQRGTPFREAYREVVDQVDSGSFSHQKVDIPSRKEQIVQKNDVLLQELDDIMESFCENIIRQCLQALFQKVQEISK
ncbi:MAG: argininosuccinate lyase [Calditrichia bacterium]